MFYCTEQRRLQLSVDKWLGHLHTKVSIMEIIYTCDYQTKWRTLGSPCNVSLHIPQLRFSIGIYLVTFFKITAMFVCIFKHIYRTISWMGHHIAQIYFFQRSGASAILITFIIYFKKSSFIFYIVPLICNSWCRFLVLHMDFYHMVYVIVKFWSSL